jgi:hypothetical protein
MAGGPGEGNTVILEGKGGRPAGFSLPLGVLRECFKRRPHADVAEGG